MEGKVHLGWGQGSLTMRGGDSDPSRLPPCQGAKLKKPLLLATLSKLEGGWELVACWGMCNVQLALS